MFLLDGSALSRIARVHTKTGGDLAAHVQQSLQVDRSLHATVEIVAKDTEMLQGR
jgi:hypothetical protein